MLLKYFLANIESYLLIYGRPIDTVTDISKDCKYPFGLSTQLECYSDEEWDQENGKQPEGVAARRAGLFTDPELSCRISKKHSPLCDLCALAVQAFSTL